MNRLIQLRAEKKVSQSELSKLLNVTQQAYSRYERGERELGYEALKTLSDFFDVSIDYLLGYSDYYYPDKLNAEEYSVEEIQLIKDYRELSPQLKTMIKETIKTFNQSQPGYQQQKRNAND